MSDEERTRIFRKVEALMAKTVAAGATEEEALTAAAKARELIEKYQIDLGAEAVKREGFLLRDIRLDGYKTPFVRSVSYAIERFTEVKMWFTVPYGLPATVWVFGLKSDVELAVHLIESLSAHALGGLSRHAVNGSAGEVRAARHAFVVGCARSAGDKLMAQVREREVRASGNGRELVEIDKPTILQNELKARGMKFSKGNGTTVSDTEAYGAGAAHGEGASFGRPIKDGRVAGLIEHSK
jgi:Protein of unknown function (DUF2786)